MKRSKRLEAVLSFVEPAESAADIGTDHGYVPMELVLRGRVRRALAMDVRSGPLKKAGEHIRAAGLGEQIKTRLSDGLSELSPGEADCIVIAGMGGELLIHIMEEGTHMWGSAKQWVLSPQSDLCKVRCWLFRNGFGIGREEMVFEDGKYYTVLDVRRKAAGAVRVRYGRLALEKMTPDFLYGKYLIETRHPVLLEYLKKEERTFLELKKKLEAEPEQTGRMKERISGIEEKLFWNREVQNEMQRDH